MKLIRSIARLVGTVLLVLVAFFLVGVFAPNVELETSILVESTDAEVFESLTHPELIGIWMPDYGSLQIENETELAFGTTFELTLAEEKTTSVISGVITALRHPDHLVFDFSRIEVSGQMSILITEVDGKTQVTALMKPIGNDLVSRSVLPIIQSSLQTDLEKRLEALKHYLES